MPPTREAFFLPAHLAGCLTASPLLTAGLWLTMASALRVETSSRPPWFGEFLVTEPMRIPLQVHHAATVALGVVCIVADTEFFRGHSRRFIPRRRPRSRPGGAAADWRTARCQRSDPGTHPAPSPDTLLTLHRDRPSFPRPQQLCSLPGGGPGALSCQALARRTRLPDPSASLLDHPAQK